MNCCHPFTGACNQGENCPVRETPLPPLDLPAPMHCEKSKQSCATPWTCAPACRLVTANSDGSDADQKLSSWYRRPPSLYFFAVVVALIGFGLAFYQTLN